MSYPLAQTSAPPLDWPHYGIGFVDAIKRAYKKYATFSGRASRSEYWWFALYLTIVYLVLGTATAVAGIATSPDGGDTPGALAALPGIPMILLLLASIVPGIALSVRRLHDAGYSGWLYLINLVPYLGGLVLIIFLAMPTSPAAAKYGPPAPPGYPPNPYYPPASDYPSQPGYPPQQDYPPQQGYPPQQHQQY